MTFAGGQRDAVKMVQHQERLNLQHGTYVGDVSNGKPHGAGTMNFKEDDAAERKTYEGAWVDGKRTGHGCMTWRNGEVCTAQVGPMDPTPEMEVFRTPSRRHLGSHFPC